MKLLIYTCVCICVCVCVCIYIYVCVCVCVYICVYIYIYIYIYIKWQINVCVCIYSFNVVEDYDYYIISSASWEVSLCAPDFFNMPTQQEMAYFRGICH